MAAVEKEWRKLEKILAWKLTIVRSEKEVIEEARNKDRKVHFAAFMDLCHLKNSYQKYKGKVAFRGYTVEYDSGSCAVLLNKDHQHLK